MNGLVFRAGWLKYVRPIPLRAIVAAIVVALIWLAALTEWGGQQWPAVQLFQVHVQLGPDGAATVQQASLSDSAPVAEACLSLEHDLYERFGLPTSVDFRVSLCGGPPGLTADRLLEALRKAGLLSSLLAERSRSAPGFARVASDLIPRLSSGESSGRHIFWSNLVLAGIIGAAMLLAAMALPMIMIVSAARARRRLSRQGRCHLCGYDPKGLASTCPECGATPIQQDFTSVH